MIIWDWLEELRRRPLQSTVLSALFAALLGLFLPALPQIILSGVFLVTGMILFLLVRWDENASRENTSRRTLLAAMATAVFVGSFSSWLYFDVHLGRAEELIADHREEAIPVEGWCEKVSYTTDFACGYEVCLTAVNGRSVSLKAVLTTEYNSDIAAGETFSVMAVLAELEDDPYNSIDTRLYRLSKGFVLEVLSHDSTGLEITGQRDISLIGRLEALNRRLSARLRLILLGDEGDLAAAVFLGNRNHLDPHFRWQMRRLGVTHLLAVSGLHLSVVMNLLRFLLNRTRIRRYTKFFIQGITAIAYMALTGFSLSVVRSTVMLLLSYAITVAGQRSRPSTNLFCTMALIVVVNPPAILDMGLNLSFAATLGLTTGAGSFRRWIRKIPGKHLPAHLLRGALESLSAGLVCVLYTLPLSCLYFGEFSPASPLATMLLTPMVHVILFLTPMVLLTYPLAFLYVPLSIPLKFFSAVMVRMTGALSDRLGGSISLRYDFVPYLLGAVLLAMVILRMLQFRRTFAILLSSVLGISAFLICLAGYQLSQRDITTMMMLNHGKSEGILLVRNGQSLLCDLSDGGYTVTKMGKSLAGDYHCPQLDGYLLTHYHQRHISTVSRLLAETRVETLLLPEPLDETEEQISCNIQQLAQRYRSDVLFYPHEQIARLETGEFALIIPPKTMIGRSTHPVIALALSDGEHTLLYCGGSTLESTLAEFAHEQAEEASVLIFGMHSPVTKQELTLPDLSDSVEAVVYGSEEVLALSGLRGKADTYLMQPDEVLTVHLYPRKE